VRLSSACWAFNKLDGECERENSAACNRNRAFELWFAALDQSY